MWRANDAINKDWLAQREGKKNRKHQEQTALMGLLAAAGKMGVEGYKGYQTHQLAQSQFEASEQARQSLEYHRAENTWNSKIQSVVAQINPYLSRGLDVEAALKQIGSNLVYPEVVGTGGAFRPFPGVGGGQTPTRDGAIVNLPKGVGEETRERTPSTLYPDGATGWDHPEGVGQLGPTSGPAGRAGEVGSPFDPAMERGIGLFPTPGTSESDFIDVPTLQSLSGLANDPGSIRGVSALRGPPSSTDDPTVYAWNKEQPHPPAGTVDIDALKGMLLGGSDPITPESQAIDADIDPELEDDYVPPLLSPWVPPQGGRTSAALGPTRQPGQPRQPRQQGAGVSGEKDIYTDPFRTLIEADIKRERPARDYEALRDNLQMVYPEHHDVIERYSPKKLEKMADAAEKEGKKVPSTSQNLPQPPQVEAPEGYLTPPGDPLAALSAAENPWDRPWEDESAGLQRILSAGVEAPETPEGYLTPPGDVYTTPPFEAQYGLNAPPEGWTPPPGWQHPEGDLGELPMLSDTTDFTGGPETSGTSVGMYPQPVVSRPLDVRGPRKTWSPGEEVRMDEIQRTLDNKALQDRAQWNEIEGRLQPTPSPSERRYGLEPPPPGWTPPEQGAPNEPWGDDRFLDKSVGVGGGVGGILGLLAAASLGGLPQEGPTPAQREYRESIRGDDLSDYDDPVPQIPPRQITKAPVVPTERTARVTPTTGGGTPFPKATDRPVKEGGETYREFQSRVDKWKDSLEASEKFKLARWVATHLSEDRAYGPDGEELPIEALKVAVGEISDMSLSEKKDKAEQFRNNEAAAADDLRHLTQGSLYSNTIPNGLIEENNLQYMRQKGKAVPGNSDLSMALNKLAGLKIFGLETSNWSKAGKDNDTNVITENVFANNKLYRDLKSDPNAWGTVIGYVSEGMANKGERKIALRYIWSQMERHGLDPKRMFMQADYGIKSQRDFVAEDDSWFSQADGRRRAKHYNNFLEDLKPYAEEFLAANGETITRPLPFAREPNVWEKKEADEVFKRVDHSFRARTRFNGESETVEKDGVLGKLSTVRGIKEYDKEFGRRSVDVDFVRNFIDRWYMWNKINHADRSSGTDIHEWWIRDKRKQKLLDPHTSKDADLQSTEDQNPLIWGENKPIWNFLPH